MTSLMIVFDLSRAEFSSFGCHDSEIETFCQLQDAKGEQRVKTMGMKLSESIMNICVCKNVNFLLEMLQKIDG